MEGGFKKYLPWVIGGIIVLLILRKFMGAGTTQPTVVPQTQITQTPQTDPLAQLRGDAFNQLAQFGLGTIQAETAAYTAQTQSAANTALAQTQAQLQYQLANRSLDTQLQQTQLISDAQNAAAELNLQQQAYNAASQNAAIQRYYSSVNQANILGSINTALGSLFGGGGSGIFGGSGIGGIFGTPPICC